MGGAGAVSLIIRAALAGAATAPAADPGTDTACCVEMSTDQSLFRTENQDIISTRINDIKVLVNVHINIMTLY